MNASARTWLAAAASAGVVAGTVAVTAVVSHGSETQAPHHVGAAGLSAGAAVPPPPCPKPSAVKQCAAWFKPYTGSVAPPASEKSAQGPSVAAVTLGLTTAVVPGFSSDRYLVSRASWTGLIAGRYYRLWAGCAGPDPQQSIVVVIDWLPTANGAKTDAHTAVYPAPGRDGELRISSVSGPAQDAVFDLAAPDGARYAFDLSAGSYR